METESEKYKKVMSLLRKSIPDLNSTEDIEIEVIKLIKKSDRPGFNLTDAIDFLFGWVYIGWVRRTFITASVVLVLVFIYQQGIILKRIDTLSRQTVINNKADIRTPSDEIERLLTVYKNSGHLFSSRNITISESQMKDLLESVKELQIKYKDLEKIIEEDPDLKKMIEKKLMENDQTKTKL